MSPPVRQIALSIPPTPGPQNHGFWLPHSQIEKNSRCPVIFCCTFNGACNLRILHRAGPLLFCSAAPVHLDIIEAPLRKLQEILFVMPLAPRIHVLGARVGVHAATVAAGVGVNPRLQSQAVNVIGDVGHVTVSLPGLNGRPLLWIDENVAGGIALAQPPAFVDDHILITGFFHPVRG